MMVLDLPYKKMHLCCYQSFTMKKDLYTYSRAYSLPVFEPVFKKSCVWSSRCSFVFVDPSLRCFLGFTRNGMEFFGCQKHHFDQVGQIFYGISWPCSPWFLEKNSFSGHGLKRMQVPKKLELVLGGALLRQAIQKRKMMDFFNPRYLAGFV